MTSTEILMDRFPEFSTVDVDELARIDRHLAYAAGQMSSAVWGTLYQMGAVCLAAHMLKIGDMTADGSLVTGPLKSHKADKVVIAYDTTGLASDAQLRMTTYGNEYLRLRRMLIRTPLVATGDTDLIGTIWPQT